MMTAPMRILGRWSAPRCISSVIADEFHLRTSIWPIASEYRYGARATIVAVAPISRLSPVSSRRGARLLAEPGYGDDLRDYLAPLRQHWTCSRSVTLLAMLAAFAVSKYQLTSMVSGDGNHQADDAAADRGSSSGTARRRQPRDASVSFVGSQYNSDAAQEYITILTSFSFITAMVEHHHLEAEMLPRGKSWPSLDARQWAMYRPHACDACNATIRSRTAA